MLLYSLPEILFLKRHGLKGLYSWGVSWGVAYVPTMQLKKLATMLVPAGLTANRDDRFFFQMTLPPAWVPLSSCLPPTTLHVPLVPLLHYYTTYCVPFLLMLRVQRASTNSRPRTCCHSRPESRQDVHERFLVQPHLAPIRLLCHY